MVTVGQLGWPLLQGRWAVAKGSIGRCKGVRRFEGQQAERANTGPGKPAPRPFAGKVEKRRGGLRDRRRALGAPAGLRLPPFFLSPPKRHREGPGKGANKQNSKKRKLQEYGEMRTSEAFSSGCCSSIGYLGIFAKERRPQRSLRPPRPSDRALSVSLLRMRLLQA